MSKRFKKLAHCTKEENSALRDIRVKINVVAYMLELSVKYSNEKQSIISRLELERLKKEYDALLEAIFQRTGVYPTTGRIEIHRSGDVMEYFSNK